MKKAELKQLQSTVDILDRESERDVYGDGEFLLFENATATLLVAIRAASLEIEEEEIPATLLGLPVVISEELSGFKEGDLIIGNFDDLGKP